VGFGGRISNDGGHINFLIHIEIEGLRPETNHQSSQYFYLKQYSVIELIV
jgi:hypothetical protein